MNDETPMEDAGERKDNRLLALAAAAANPKPRDYIPVMHLLSASVLDPRTEMNLKVNRLAVDRFEVVPNLDALLCYSGLEVFHLQPPTTPNYLPQTMSEQWKLRGILDQRSLGLVDHTGMAITLHPNVARAIQAQQKKEDSIKEVVIPRMEEESKEAAAAAASSEDAYDEAMPAPTMKFSYSELPPVPSHSIYPISVQLTLKPGEVDDLRSRLQRDVEDTKTQPYCDNVWPRAIKYYHAFEYHVNPSEHYSINVLSSAENVDPYFNLGLFGCYRNGLSVVLLALSNFQEKAKLGSSKMPKLGMSASSSSSAAAAAAAPPSPSMSAVSETRVHSLLCQYITLVALQFWTMVHGRWLELDPKEANPSKTHMPQYLFYFHHTTDFTQTNRHKRSKKAKAKKRDAAPSAVPLAADISNMSELTEAARGGNNEGAFIPFLAAVFKYVLKRMTELADSVDPQHNEIGIACKRLRMTESFVEEHGQNCFTNHTQFFTCARLKAHPVRGLTDVINRQFRSGNSVAEVIGDATPKFFPRNKDDLKMKLPKQVSDTKICAENRYIMPYFWSHMTITPDSPVVQTESVLKQSSIYSVVHQAAVLRRLMFCMNSNDSALIKDLFNNMGDCELSFNQATKPPISMPCSEFYTRFVESRPREVDLSSMREHMVVNPLVIPPVVPPGIARYCMYFDEETGRTYVPALSRDFGSMPSLHESDVTSMTKYQFIRAYHRGIIATMGNARVFKDANALAEIGVIRKEPLLCEQLSHTGLAKGEALRQISGLSETYSKLDPDDPRSDWAYHSGRFRLTKLEKKELLRIVKGERLAQDVGAHLPLWTLLTKICLYEQQAVASYVFHLTVPLIKQEPGLPPPPPPSAWRLGRLLRALQEERYARQQIDLEAFTASWGPMLPGRNNPRKRSHQAASSDEADKSAQHVNLYWPSQRSFLAEIEAVWNHCDKPVIEGPMMGNLVRGLLDVDLPLMDFVLIDTRGFTPSRNLRHTDEGSTSDENTQSLREFFHHMLSEAYEKYSWNAANQNAFDFMTQRKSGLLNAVPGIGRPQGFAPGTTKLLFRCNAPAGSKLLTRFQYFFNLEANVIDVYFANQFLNGMVAFFFWYYYTCVLRPFIAHMPVLYPDCSLIKYKTTRGPPMKWIHSLIPSDATPVLSKILFSFLATLSKSNIFGELETAVAHHAQITEKAETALIASQMAIRAQDDIELEDSQNTRLLQVYDYATTLLTRKHNEEGIHSVVATSSLYQSSRKWGIQETATKVIVKSILFRKNIPDLVISTLFSDLCAVTEPQEDPTQAIAVVLVHVLKELKTLQNYAAVQTLHRILDVWKNRKEADQLLPNVSRMTLNTQEFKR